MLTFPVGLISRLYTPPVTPALRLIGGTGMYDATSGGSLVTADEATIARWEDQSGNARHVTQSTSGSRPRLDATALHVVDPMPDQRHFTFPGSFTVDRRDFTVLWLGRMTSLRRAQNGTGVEANHVLIRSTSDAMNLFYTGTGSSADMGKLSGYDGSASRITNNIPYTTDLTALAFRGNGSNFATWVRNTKVTTTLMNSGTATLSLLGWGGVAGNGGWQSSLQELLIYQRALTDSEIETEWWNYAKQQGVAASPVNQIVFVGDSITHGYASTLNRNWPSKLDLPNVYKRVTAESGTTLSTISGQSAREDSLLRAGETNILCVWLGTNDLDAGTAGATLAASYETYCAARQAAGWTVVAFTILPRGTFNATKETHRGTFNTTVRADWTDYADALVDVAADTRLDDYSDTTYFDADTIHLKDAGLAVVAELAEPEIEGLL